MKRFAFVLMLIFAVTFSHGQALKNPALTAGINGPTIALSCTAGITPPPISGYKFYRGTVSSGPYTLVGTASTCAFTDTTGSYNTTYYYVATSVNTTTCPVGQVCESSYSNQVTAVVGASPIPNPPQNLVLNGPITQNSIPLKWDAPIPQAGTVVSNYVVFSCSKPLCPAPGALKTLPVTQTTFVATCVPVPPATHRTCYFEVRAKDEVNGVATTSAYSNIVAAVL